MINGKNQTNQEEWEQSFFIAVSLLPRLIFEKTFFGFLKTI